MIPSTDWPIFIEKKNLFYFCCYCSYGLHSYLSLLIANQITSILGKFCSLLQEFKAF